MKPCSAKVFCSSEARYLFQREEGRGEGGAAGSPGIHYGVIQVYSRALYKQIRSSLWKRKEDLCFIVESATVFRYRLVQA